MDVTEEGRLRAVEAELALIENMPLAQLRAVWAARWGDPPRFRSPDLLRRLIAWRLQAPLFGDLDLETKAVLRRRSTPRSPPPPAGSQLTREYRGVLHKVDVDVRAFRYQGRSYRSLSAVARVITGTKWNGPRFFGLRNSVTAP